jgi:hypothetical protein
MEKCGWKICSRDAVCKEIEYKFKRGRGERKKAKI